MADASLSTTSLPNDLESYWMPMTPNRQFKADPRILVGAKDMHYTTHDGRRLLDGTAGMWCVNAGHCRKPIIQAISARAGELDYAPAFNMSAPFAFEVASRIAALTPADLDRVFFTNSGSESADTALKIALGYHRLRGEGSRQRLIGRQQGYHGVNFGGLSVGGIAANRKMVGPLLPGVDHLPHTLNIEKNAFSRGQPQWGAELADELERIVAINDASTIAAVIVEPMSGSAGVLPPPKGYLERLREICDKYGILLIFDEVITGFGRLGAAFAAEKFGVIPDIMTLAKGITSGTVPMGAVVVREGIYQTFMSGPEDAIEFCHGYTYSGHPIACAAAIATFDLYRDEGVFENAAELAPYWEEALHSLKDLPRVVDIRNIGIVGAIDFESARNGEEPLGTRAFLEAYERGVLIRGKGDTILLSPPLIIDKSQIDEIAGTLEDVIKGFD
ncbi:MAG: aspartate aminotransferase family protein [Alphaproteobacteria bacterium]|nr:aspartate aminotransferase family protein [Alphaproteobacteria bacterium]|tara:strand:- start:156 stop:1493 length:1338 start_codon:yes stop_codon:yes gene_type:complete